VSEITGNEYPEDVSVVRTGDREFILVGTAHISRNSADLVRRVIANERPDRVCVELDPQRFKALTEKKRWENLNLKEMIRGKQLPMLIIHLMLHAYQKRLGGTLGVMPGTELLEATKAAEEYGIPVALCDRDVRVTLKRAWRTTPFYKKTYLLACLLAGVFQKTELTEDNISEIKKQDVLSEMIREMGAAMPSLKRVLIDERDTYLSEKIKAAEGRRIVAVVGAGHIEGIREALLTDRRSQMAEIETIPPASRIGRILGWAVPCTIIAMIAMIARNKGGSVAMDNILYWTLANGIPTAVGGILALAHPVTILVGFLAAPATSLTPIIGAGYVTAFTQAFFQPPIVRDFENASEDMATFTGWWHNRLLKVFLTFFLPGIGSMIGTWIGGCEIVSNLF
jgi:pheromone shutdown-related protein TraB